MPNQNQDRAPLVDALKAYQKERPAYFCIPGHRYGRGVSSRWLTEEETSILKYDLTETTGLDDLHQPEGVIREAQKLLADLYGADRSWFLVNGTTCGNEAMLLSTLRGGDRVLVPRNVHKSVMEGLILCGAKPDYLMPEYLDEEGLFGGVSPEAVDRMLARCPDIRAVFLVNPTYYGFFSDTAAIATVCHSRGVPLLVDEAHGGHVYFSEELPEGALMQGADLCAQSFHKVTGALTQSSVLHLHSQLIAAERVDEALSLVQSSSPSYLLMASLDAARYELAMRGGAMMDRARMLANAARLRINTLPGMHCLTEEEITGRARITGLDGTRLTFECRGMSGYALQQILRSRFHVETELADDRHVLAIVTYANEENEIDALVSGLTVLAKERDGMSAPLQRCAKDILPQIPPAVYTPREAYFAPKQAVMLEQSVGRIAGEPIAPYPPGIPIICPGERMTEEILEAVVRFRRQGCRFHGPADPALSTFRILRI